jgi:hypothetical protein
MSALSIPDLAMAFSAAFVLAWLGVVSSSQNRRSRIPVINSKRP